MESRAEELRKAKYKPTRLAVDEFAVSTLYDIAYNVIVSNPPRQ